MLKLNQECVRSALLDIESHSTWDSAMISFSTPGGLQTFKSSDLFGRDEFLYTLDKLVEAKFVKGKPTFGSNTIVDFQIYGLTWDGHQFLDTIRDPKVWSKTKQVTSHLESVSINLLSNIGTGVLNHMIDKSFLS